MMLTLAELAPVLASHAADLNHPVAEFNLRGHSFHSLGKPSLMGVVNLSPDSWYRESVCLNTEQAVQRGLRLHAEGAALVDLGAESTLLTAARTDAGAQNNRLLPVLEGLARQGVRVSVETYLPEVAERCLKSGACVLNLTATVELEPFFRMAAAHDAGVILCFVAGDHVRAVETLDLDGDHTQTLLDYFAPRVELARSCGVTRLWLDPGMGFYYKNLQDSAERVRYQMRTFLHTFRLRKLGWPVCHALPHAFEYFGEQVRTAEPFFAVLASLGQTGLLRTHEVAKVKGVIDSLEAWNA
jgi:dihydropteroate synthase